MRLLRNMLSNFNSNLFEGGMYPRNDVVRVGDCWNKLSLAGGDTSQGRGV